MSLDLRTSSIGYEHWGNSTEKLEDEECGAHM